MTTNKLKLDLHMHSTSSDGTYTPQELIELGERSLITHMALTDHDTVEGVREFRSAKSDVVAIAGVELSIKYDGDGQLHVVGLFLDIENTKLNALLKFMQEHRGNRNSIILSKLSALLKEDITIEDIAGANSSIIGRPHIAKYLIERGYASSISEAFDKYLGKGGLIYAPKETIVLREAVDCIKSAGGVAVVAHPSKLKLKGDDYIKAIKGFADEGIDAIEVFSSHSKIEDIPFYIDVTKKFNLAFSGGSDFHGNNAKVKELGANFTPYTEEEILLSLESRK